MTALAGAGPMSSTPDAFHRSCEADLARARQQITGLRAATGLEALARYDDAMAALSDVGNRAGLCRNAHPSAAMREVAERAEQAFDALATEISLDHGVYQALFQIDASGEDAATQHYLRKTLRDFRRAGVDKDELSRARIRALRDELTKIGQEFGNNIKDDVRSLELDPSALNGLPEDFRAAHPIGTNGKVRLTTDNTDYVPFVTYSLDGKAREALWRLYRLRGHPKNLDVLSRMLERRAELARLLGYESWAAYATEDKMIGSQAQAAEFIERITEVSGARMKRDHAQLLERKKEDDPNATAVQSWDNAFLTERIKSEQYGFDAQAARPYFEYSRVKQGVLDTTAAMFGISYQPVREAQVWHSDVEVYDVLEGGQVLGRIYLDMHPRDGKYKHYAQFPLVSGVSRGDSSRLPEGALLCNFPQPKAGGPPALMEHGDVETFFHEFGHLLHHVLGGHTRWVGLSGVATEWDFVEAPSQMLEEWVWDPLVLGRFARHITSGEPIPTELVKKAREADEYGKGLWVRQQMFYAALSIQLHSREPKGLDSTAVMAELQARYTPFRHVDGTFFHESFGHLEGYSAIYYTYMWSLVIAKDMFSVFKREGLMSPKAAKGYRQAVLEPGGSKPAAELVADFLGRPYGFEAYEKWLNAA